MKYLIFHKYCHPFAANYILPEQNNHWIIMYSSLLTEIKDIPPLINNLFLPFQL